MNMADVRESTAEQPSYSVDDEKNRPSKLDLAFAMDCTSSMRRYIQSAQQVSVDPFVESEKIYTSIGGYK